MADKKTVKQKLAKRQRQQERQTRLWKETGKAGHGRAAKAHTRAIRKLKQILRKLFRRIDWNGKAPVGGPNLRKAVRYALNNFDVYITSTNGGTHTPTSYHYRNQAVDIGSDSADEKARCQRALLVEFGPLYFAELFGPDNGYFVKNGSQYVATEGEFNENLHDDHIHMAITS